MQKIVDDAFCDYAVAAYARTLSADRVGRELNCSRVPVLKALRMRGIEIPSRSECRARAARLRTPRNDQAFDVLTEEVLYWIGFLWADGHITTSGRVCLGLAAKDRAQVEAFRDFCGVSVPIKERDSDKLGHRSCSFVLYSKYACNRLTELGFTSPKRDRDPSSAMRASVSFWRGVIDGDGTLGVYTPYGRKIERVSLVGGHATLSRFLDFARLCAGPHNCHVSDLGNYAQTALHGRCAYNMIHVLYTADGPALARKRLLAQRILADRANHWSGRAL